MAKKSPRKERIPRLHVEIKEDIILHIENDFSRIEFRNSQNEIIEDLPVSVGQCYKRKGKGDKVLRLGRNKTGGLIDFKGKASIYDRYLAIDTSYIEFGKSLICAACCMMTNQQTNKDGNYKKGDGIKILLFSRLVFLAKQNTKPERHGWMWFINNLVKSDLFDPSIAYGVIVDSDLNEIPKINDKKIPIVDGYFLPNNFSLIYASVDAGNENGLNKLIKATDKLARKSLDIAVNSFEDKKNIEMLKEYLDVGVLNEEINLSQYLNL